MTRIYDIQGTESLKERFGNIQNFKQYYRGMVDECLKEILGVFPAGTNEKKHKEQIFGLLTPVENYIYGTYSSFQLFTTVEEEFDALFYAKTYQYTFGIVSTMDFLNSSTQEQLRNYSLTISKTSDKTLQNDSPYQRIQNETAMEFANYESKNDIETTSGNRFNTVTRLLARSLGLQYGNLAREYKDLFGKFFSVDQQSGYSGRDDVDFPINR